MRSSWSSRAGFVSLALASVVFAAHPALADPIDDSFSVRDDLLATASTLTYDSSGNSANAQVFHAWETAYPDLRIVSAVTAANPTQVSVYADFVVSKPKGTGVLPFAVADASGNCAGGLAIMVGTDRVPTDFQPVDVSSGPTCNAQAVMAAYNAS